MCGAGASGRLFGASNQRKRAGFSCCVVWAGMLAAFRTARVPLAGTLARPLAGGAHGMSFLFLVVLRRASCVRRRVGYFCQSAPLLRPPSSEDKGMQGRRVVGRLFFSPSHTHPPVLSSSCMWFVLAATRVTIIRQQQAQQITGAGRVVVAKGGSTSAISSNNNKDPLSASMTQQQQQQGMLKDSSWHSTGSASSVHMLSSSLPEARAVEPPQIKPPHPDPHPKQKPKSRRRIWSRQSSRARAVAPSDDDDDDNDNDSLPGGSENGRAGSDSPGRWSDVGVAVRGRADWETASVDGGGGSQWKAQSAARRSVFSESGTGPRRRISFRKSSS